MKATSTESHDNGALVKTDEDKPNLAIVSMTPGMTSRVAVAQTEPELLGWNVRKNKGKPQPATTVLQDKQVKVRIVMATLLLPLKAGEEFAAPRIHQTADGYKVVLKDGRIINVAENSTRPAEWDKIGKPKQNMTVAE